MMMIIPTLRLASLHPPLLQRVPRNIIGHPHPGRDAGVSKVLFRGATDPGGAQDGQQRLGGVNGSADPQRAVCFGEGFEHGGARDRECKEREGRVVGEEHGVAGVAGEVGAWVGARTASSVDSNLTANVNPDAVNSGDWAAIGVVEIEAKWGICQRNVIVDWPRVEIACGGGDRGESVQVGGDRSGREVIEGAASDFWICDARVSPPSDVMVVVEDGGVRISESVVGGEVHRSSSGNIVSGPFTPSSGLPVFSFFPSLGAGAPSILTVPTPSVAAAAAQSPPSIFLRILVSHDGHLPPLAPSTVPSPAALVQFRSPPSAAAAASPSCRISSLPAAPLSSPLVNGIARRLFALSDRRRVGTLPSLQAVELQELPPGEGGMSGGDLNSNRVDSGSVRWESRSRDANWSRDRLPPAASTIAIEVEIQRRATTAHRKGQELNIMPRRVGSQREDGIFRPSKGGGNLRAF
ncbi:hypothetical protein BDK51DRAFT_32759 [Blyttiomyces helicus]|uniref:Uncharacterized protein n=1 Tax=Blyttiomyces helicus TaxID=388810 RepID=A0A4P9W2K1_9FUNG|nr:hypothetical protein BDK51DRAFT_32759 [Blyttiomyces helicus]|eukprot:RKO84830.1 hypothetical protein BDK51DRAFT_32759 [Blyttiomyces helicus]